MIQANTISELRSLLRDSRNKGLRIVFVPTMGNLHEGHLQLVRHAGDLGDVVVTSIFVNPMQFGEGEDFERYPRTLDADKQALATAKNDIVFTPEPREIYPRPLNDMTSVRVPELSDVLCGQYRPGHFDGVCTVVAKLFNIVRADIACFGEKDYQQLLIIRRMVQDLDFPVRIEGVAIQRDPDGLALSSRNNYLSEEQRAQAPLLYQQLKRLREQLIQNFGARKQYLTESWAYLQEHGFKPEYLELRNAEDLKPAQSGDQHIRIFVAAYLGNTRLIDNIPL